MPGIGPRSAERIALWIVQARGDQPEHIARTIAATRESVRPCPRCGFFTMEEICGICSDTTRAADLLCVVEQATDILPLEKTSAFRGRYHSLGGRISPLDHVGPDDLRIKELVARVEQEKFSEVILATVSLFSAGIFMAPSRTVTHLRPLQDRISRMRSHRACD